MRKTGVTGPISNCTITRNKATMCLFDDRKKYLKKRAFEIVADQTGKVFDPNVLTIVWARRFAGYKRAELITRDMERFKKLTSNTKYPVQIIWAGKPYPLDYPAIAILITWCI